MILRLLTDWAAQIGSLWWLAVALVAAAGAAFFGFGVPAQIGMLVVVMTVSLVVLRANLLERLAGAACRRAPSRSSEGTARSPTRSIRRWAPAASPSIFASRSSRSSRSR